MAENNNKETVVVLGASPNPARYSYKAVLWLKDTGFHVIAVGKKKGSIGNTPIIEELPNKIPNLYTITIYLNPMNQTEYYNKISELKPKQVIFNPLAENVEFSEKLKITKIKTIDACTLVMLKTGQF